MGNVIVAPNTVKSSQTSATVPDSSKSQMRIIPIAEGISAVVNKWNNPPQQQKATITKTGINLDPNTAYKLVLLRHGESTWNKLNLFTGWTDVSLTKTGIIAVPESFSTN